MVGDSITDGFHSTVRWTDVLQRRIAALPVALRPAVVNEAITANTLTAVEPSDARTGGGPPGLERTVVDALDQPGVATVVVFLGTNDLYFGASAPAVIAGLQQAAAMAHQHGVRIVAATLLPRAGSEGWSGLCRWAWGTLRTGSGQRVAVEDGALRPRTAARRGPCQPGWSAAPTRPAPAQRHRCRR